MSLACFCRIWKFWTILGCWVSISLKFKNWLNIDFITHLLTTTKGVLKRDTNIRAVLILKFQGMPLKIKLYFRYNLTKLNEILIFVKLRGWNHAHIFQLSKIKVGKYENNFYLEHFMIICIFKHFIFDGLLSPQFKVSRRALNEGARS